MKFQTKFKYNDKVKIINTDIKGELVDVIPLGMIGKVPLYNYKMFTIDKGFILVQENVLELLE